MKQVLRIARMKMKKLSDITDDSKVVCHTDGHYNKSEHYTYLYIDGDHWIYRTYYSGGTILRPYNVISHKTVMSEYFLNCILKLDKNNPKESVMRFKRLMLLK